MMQPEVSIVEYIATLDSQGFDPKDFRLESWAQGVQVLRRFVRDGVIDPRFPDIIDNFQQLLSSRQRMVEAARSSPTPPTIRTGTLYVTTERGTRVINMLSNRPDLVRDFDIRDNDLIALFQIAENPGMSEDDLEISNQRGAIIALRQRGLIEPV